MPNLTKFLAFAIVFLAMACGKTEQKIPNSALLNNAPETKVYKEELATLLDKTDPALLEFYFDHYLQKDGTDYLYVNIKGAIDATAVVTVREWDEHLKIIREFKGKGYGGSEFRNLKLNVERDSVNTAFIYKGMDGIFD